MHTILLTCMHLSTIYSCEPPLYCSQLVESRRVTTVTVKSPSTSEEVLGVYNRSGKNPYSKDRGRHSNSTLQEPWMHTSSVHPWVLGMYQVAHLHTWMTAGAMDAHIKCAPLGPGHVPGSTPTHMDDCRSHGCTHQVCTPGSWACTR